MKTKTITYVIAAVFIVSLSATFAFLIWNSPEDTRVEFSIGDIADVVFEEGNNLVVENLAPTLSIDGGSSLIFSVKKRTTSNVSLNISFLPTVFDTSLKDESFKYAIYHGTTANSQETLIASNNFALATVDTEIDVATYGNLVEGDNYFKVIVWIDGNMDNPIDMMNKKCSFKINVEAAS